MVTNYNGGIIGRTDGGTTLSRVYNTGLRVNQDSSTSYMGVHGAFIGTKTDVFTFRLAQDQFLTDRGLCHLATCKRSVISLL